MLLTDGVQDTGLIHVYAVYNLNGCTSGVAATAVGSGWTSVSSSIASSTNGYCRIQLTGTSNSINAVTPIFAPDAGSGTAALDWSYNGSDAPGHPDLWLHSSKLLRQPRLMRRPPAKAKCWPMSSTAHGTLAAPRGGRRRPRVRGLALTPAPATPRPGLGYAFLRRGPTLQSMTTRSGSIFENFMPGALVQTSSDPTFVSPAGVTQDTIPSAPFYPRWQLNARSLSSPAGRAIRVQMPTGAYGSICST